MLGLAKPTATKRRVLQLPLESIEPNPNQPRQLFDEAQLQSLAQSIARNGLLVPVTVVESTAGGYTLVAGERRLRACKLLGLRDIPCIVERFDNEQSAVLALVENLHREDLHYFEEAKSIHRLIDELGLTQSRVCTLLNLSQPTVSNKLRLLRLPQSIRELLMENDLPERVARALLRIDDEELQLQTLKQIVDRQYSIQRAEQLVEDILHKENVRRQRKSISHDHRLIFGAVDELVREIRSIGVIVQAKRTESPAYYEYTIRVKKEE